MASDDTDAERLPEESEPYPGKAPAGERELSDDELEKQALAKTAATEALEDGQLHKALESFTEAIVIGNVSAMLYAKRADLLLKLKRPCACISDCSSAIEINPDSAKAYRIRGIAYRKIGKWEDAHKDISLSQQLDYDDDLVETQKFVAERYELMKQRAADAAEAEAAAARAAARAAAAEAATAAAAANAASQPPTYSMHEAWRQAPSQRQADSDSESCEEIEMEPEASPHRQQQRPAPEYPRTETRQQASTCEMGTQMHEDEQEAEEEEVEEPKPKATKEDSQGDIAQGDDDPERLPMDPKPYAAKGPEGHQSLSDAQIEKQNSLKQASADALEDDDRAKALDLLTQAIVIGNASAQMYAKRAEILLKLKRPCACIADCHIAVEINPDSAKAYRIRGKAWRTLGEWESAHKDISLAQKIDYDDNMVDVQKLVADRRNAIVAEKIAQRVQEEARTEENLLRRRKAHEQREQAEAETKAEAEAKAKKEGSWRGRCASCARRFRGPDPSEEKEDTADADADESDAQAGSSQAHQDSTDDID